MASPSIRYTERVAEAGIEPSVGRVGDSYDNALAETIIGLYKTELIHRRGPWRNLEAIEFATLESLHESIFATFWSRSTAAGRLSGVLSSVHDSVANGGTETRSSSRKAGAVQKRRLRLIETTSYAHVIWPAVRIVLFVGALLRPVRESLTN